MLWQAVVCCDDTSVLVCMHIIVIFGCIGTLMKCSAWEFYAIAVYGGIRGIYNIK